MDLALFCAVKENHILQHCVSESTYTKCFKSQLRVDLFCYQIHNLKRVLKHPYTLWTHTLCGHSLVRFILKGNGVLGHFKKHCVVMCFSQNIVSICCSQVQNFVWNESKGLRDELCSKSSEMKINYSDRLTNSCVSFKFSVPTWTITASNL